MMGVDAGARWRVRGVVLVLSVFLCSGLWAAGAQASKGVVGVFGSAGSGDGQLANAAGTATNVSSADIYVVDQGNNRVEQFDSNGSFIRAWGWGVADGNSAAQSCTSGCQPGIAGNGDGEFDSPQGIAVDQSDGSVYVVDANNSRVEKFSASGTYQAKFGTAGSDDGKLANPQGIAVDPTDSSVYVADTGNHRVEKFDSNGLYQAQFGSEGGGDGQFEGPTSIAVDSTGQVYVVDAGNLRIERFTSAGAFDQVFDPADIFFPSQVAVGSGNDHLYIAQEAQDFSEQRVLEVDGSGTPVDTHGVGSTASNATGVALSASSQRIYLADGFNARVFAMDDITPASAAIDPAASITATSASLSGAVNPHGGPDVTWRFETSTDDANWTPVAADADAGSGTNDVPVSAALTGLIPNTTYFVRLVANRSFNPPVISSEVQATTDAILPDATTEAAQDIRPNRASLIGLIAPHHSLTTYYFEYGTTTGYGTSVPVTQDADAGADNDVIEVTSPINGLAQNTTYHFRLVAHNAVGTIAGQDQSFKTTTPLAPSSPQPGIPGAGTLPDDRAWEQVSPIVKHGGDVIADPGRARAAADGSAASYASLGGFGDVQGTGVAAEYISVRTVTTSPGDNGWNVHAITPHQSSLTLAAVAQGLDPLWEGDFSSDLSHGVFRAWSPLTNAPAVADVENLYVRDDLRSSGPGSYQLASDCPACGSTPLPPITNAIQSPHLAGASADFSHVLFESKQPLVPGSTADSSSITNLYEWDHGTIRLAGVLPDSACGSPPCVAASSTAGQGASNAIYTPRVISADGSRIFFTDNSTTGDRSGALYMRVLGTTSVQINSSEKGVPDAPQSATFWTASADGSRAFFTTGEHLTDDDANGGVDLYLYDANAPAGHHLTRLSVDHESADPAGDVVGVIGAGSDGHHVYFASSGQLVAGQPALFNRIGIYEWNDGAITYIGEMSDPARDEVLNLQKEWALGVALSSRVTSDGRHVLFTTHSGVGLTGYDHADCGGAGCTEVYVYSADTHELQCASCNPDGSPAVASADVNVRTGNGAAGTTWHLGRAISDDGRRVFFNTVAALVPRDSNGRTDVYEFDTASGTVHLLSSGNDPSDSYFIDASGSGRDAFFVTRQQLVGWDGDQNYDLYDSRVGGGFPEPQALAPGCSGEACQGQPSSRPAATVANSSIARGGGNIKSRVKRTSTKRRVVRCKRSFVRKKVKGKVRCVKRGKRAVKPRIKHAHTNVRRAK